MKQIRTSAAWLIAAAWTLLWLFLFGHRGAVCAGFLLHVFCNEELPRATYYALLAMGTGSALAQIALSKPWPSRRDWLRRVMKGHSIPPLRGGPPPSGGVLYVRRVSPAVLPSRRGRPIRWGKTLDLIILKNWIADLDKPGERNQGTDNSVGPDYLPNCEIGWRKALQFQNHKMPLFGWTVRFSRLSHSRLRNS